MNAKSKIVGCLICSLMFAGVWWLFTLSKVPPVKAFQQEQNSFAVANKALQNAQEVLARAQADSQDAANELAQLDDVIVRNSEDSLKESTQQLVTAKQDVIRNANELIKNAKVVVADAITESEKWSLDKAESELKGADAKKVQASAEYQKSEQLKKAAANAVAKASPSKKKDLQSLSDQAAERARRAYEQMEKYDKELLAATGVRDRAEQLQTVLQNARNSLQALEKEQGRLVDNASQKETKLMLEASKAAAVSLESGRSSPAFIQAQEKVNNTKQAIEVPSQRMKLMEVEYNKARTALEASSQASLMPEIDLPTPSMFGILSGILAVMVALQAIIVWKFF